MLPTKAKEVVKNAAWRTLATGHLAATLLHRLLKQFRLFANFNLVRYPKIRVHTDSENPLALVAAVREELRLARVEASEIDRFSDQALSESRSEAIREICKAWVDLRD